MKAVVVYDSLWGNTAAVARAIAEGIGSEARAFPTDAADAEALSGADLVVAGSPVHAFSLPREEMREGLAAKPDPEAPGPPDLSHPSMRAWLESLPAGQGRAAAFETRVWWSPRGATGDIEKRLWRAGYSRAGKAQRFVVKGTYGPLREGELDRARAWGEELARSVPA